MACKALLVSVNKYKLPGSDLHDCVNDATNVRDVLLKYFSFNVKDIRVLLKRLRASLKHEDYDQIPQLECPAPWKKKKVLE